MYSFNQTTHFPTRSKMDLLKSCTRRERLINTNSPPYPYRIIYERNGQEVEELQYFDCRQTPSPTSHSDRQTNESEENGLEDGEIEEEDENKENKPENSRQNVLGWREVVIPESLLGCTAPNFYNSAQKLIVISPSREFRPESMHHFWTTPGVICVGRTVMAKRCFDGLLDNTYISRKNVRSGHKTIFKIASFCLKSLIDYMDEILSRVSISPIGIHKLAGTELLLSTQLDGNEFWVEERDTFHMNTFWMRPYLCDWGMIQFRVWEQVPERLHRHFHDGSPHWNGPRCSLTMAVFVELVKALKQLNFQGPERF